MVVKSTPNARAMPGMEGRYILMPSGLTAETATSNAIKVGRTIGCAAAGEVRVISSVPIPETAADGSQDGTALRSVFPAEARSQVGSCERSTLRNRWATTMD